MARVPRNRSVNVHDFAMVPRGDVPRSVFDRESSLKTSFDAGNLVPIFVDEVLPGDSFNLRMNIFARLSTPIVPFLDNLHFETFFFYVPNRLVWDNWRKMMGEQRNPSDSIDYILPTTTSPSGGYLVSSLQDYFGLPTAGQMVAPNTFTHTSLPLRMYNLIWNEWFRDENLQDSVPVPTGDGPDTAATFTLLKRGKRKDYFTSCLPWPQKGVAVSLPIGSTAPIKTNAATNQALGLQDSTGTLKTMALIGGVASANLSITNTNAGANNGLYADLSQATAASINSFRLAYQIQMLLEMDARGGTRYTELLYSHFGVNSPDSRLQRPEYLGGGHSPIVVNSVAQTSGTGASGQTSPQGNLAAYATITALGHGFRQSFVEHGFVIGLACVRADLTYQQGVRRMWNRSTKFDFYWPAFAHLGEQAVLNKEIFAQGLPADNNVFGYQERWGELRYLPTMVTGRMRSTAASTINQWHLAERFLTLPALNAAFIEEPAAKTLERVLAVGAAAQGVQVLLDGFIQCRTVRPLPMFSTPGLIPIL